MTTPSYSIRCLSNTLVARNIYEIRFGKPEGFEFKPGQFVLLDVPLMDDPTNIETRAFSIASSPLEEDLLFAMKMKEGGRASRWIMESLKAGDTARMQGPFGLFTLDRETPKHWLLIATSTGLAPFRSQMLTFLSSERRKIDLVFGVRSEEDFFWKELLEDWAKTHENFSAHFVLSQGSGGWSGHRGRVQTIAPLVVKNIAQRKVYVCGSPEMTKELKRVCLEEWGMTKGDFHMEGYI